MFHLGCIWGGLLGLLVVAAIAVAVVAWLVGSALTEPLRSASVAPVDWPVTTVRLPTDTGGTVDGWIALGQAGRGAVLLLHGVRADRQAMLQRARQLHRQGFGVLLMDLPAHGTSSGDRITFGVAEGAGVRAAMAYLRQQLPGEKLGVIGSSLGGAALLLSHVQPPPDAVVLEAVFPTIEAAVDNRVRSRIGPLASIAVPLLLQQLPWRLGVEPAQLRPIAHIAQLGAPVLVAGGTRDRHTPPDETLQLFDAAQAPKQLWLVDGAAHVDLYAFAPQAYEERVFGFLRQYLQKP